jgi:hypothetical protein
VAYLGHVLMDNRHGLIVNACATAATGTAEREAAVLMLTAGRPPRTLGADKGYDAASFVASVRAAGVTPCQVSAGGGQAFSGDRGPFRRHLC